MHINVVYQNGKYGVIDNSELDSLIEKKEIKRFLRPTGWCTFGVDPIREEPSIDFKGPEGRQAVKKAVQVK